MSGPRHSLFRAPALSVLGSRSGLLSRCSCWPEPAAQSCVFIYLFAAFNSDPCVTHPIQCPNVAGPQLRSACHPSGRAPSSDPCATNPRATDPAAGPHPIPRAPSSDPRATHPVLRFSAPIRIPIISVLQAFSSDPRVIHPARRVPFFQESTPNLTVWRIKGQTLGGLQPSPVAI